MRISKILKFISEVDQDKRKTRNVNLLFLLGLLLFEVGFMLGVNNLMEQSAAITICNFIMPLFILITLLAMAGVWFIYRPNKTFKIKQCADGTTEVELDDVILVVDDTDRQPQGGKENAKKLGIISLVMGFVSIPLLIYATVKSYNSINMDSSMLEWLPQVVLLPVFVLFAASIIVAYLLSGFSQVVGNGSVLPLDLYMPLLKKSQEQNPNLIEWPNT